MNASSITAGRIRGIFYLYTCLYLQIAEYNRVYLILLAGSKILLVLFAVFCTYGAIRLEGMMSFSLGWIGFSCTVFLAVLLSCLAEFYVRSSVVRKILKRQLPAVSMAPRCHHDRCVPLDKWMRKKVTATKEMRFCLGSAYYVDKPLLLTTFDIIVDQTISFLVLRK